MSVAEDLSSFFFSKTNKLSHKTALGVFGFVVILFINNVFGFTYFYTTEQKLNQIQKVNAILNDRSADSTTKVYVETLRQEIIQHKTVLDYFESFFRRSSIQPKSDQKNNANNPAKITSPSIRQSSMYFVSSRGLIYFAAVLVFIVFLQNKNIPSIWGRLAFGGFRSLLLIYLASVSSVLCDAVPQLSESGMGWNWGINYCIQVVLLLSFMIAYGKVSKLP